MRTPDLDSSRWKLSQENVQRRRRLFWQLFVIDTGLVSTIPYNIWSGEVIPFALEFLFRSAAHDEHCVHRLSVASRCRQRCYGW